jgi:predicted ester cyclase
MVADRLTMRGTHLGTFMGVPATGRRFEILGLDMMRIRDGRIVQHWW